MGWREDLIAQHRKDIEELNQYIALLREGQYQYGHHENGQFVNKNEEAIARHLKMIEKLEGAIARVEAGLTDGES